MAWEQEWRGMGGTRATLRAQASSLTFSSSPVILQFNLGKEKITRAFPFFHQLVKYTSWALAMGSVVSHWLGIWGSRWWPMSQARGKGQEEGSNVQASVSPIPPIIQSNQRLFKVLPMGQAGCYAWRTQLIKRKSVPGLKKLKIQWGKLRQESRQHKDWTCDFMDTGNSLYLLEHERFVEGHPARHTAYNYNNESNINHPATTRKKRSKIFRNFKTQEHNDWTGVARNLEKWGESSLGGQLKM